MNTKVNNQVNKNNNNEKVVNNMSNVNNNNRSGLGNIYNNPTVAARTQAGLSEIEALFANNEVLGAGGFGLPVGQHKVTVTEVKYDKDNNPVLTLKTNNSLQTRFTIYDYNKFRTSFYAQTGKEAPVSGQLVNNSFTVYSEEVKKGSLHINKTRMERSLPTIGAYQATIKNIRIYGTTGTLIIDFEINGVTYYEFLVLTAENKSAFMARIVAIAGAMGLPPYTEISAAEFLGYVGKSGTMYSTATYYAERNCITRKLMANVFGDMKEQIENPEAAEANLQFLVDKAYNEYKGIKTEETNQDIPTHVPTF